MRIRQFVLLFNILWLAIPGKTQTPVANQWCGYTGKSAWLEQYQRNKDAVISQLSLRLREMSIKYKDTSLQINVK